MKRILIIGGTVAVFILGILILQFSPATSTLVWAASQGGAWLLPLVLISSLLDSVHPCSFSILLITIAFLFGLQLTREKILQIGGVYIAGIFAAYLAIGLGALKVLHLFNTPHFMGKLGASLLILFGIITLLNRFFPNMPIKLKIPSVVHQPIPVHGRAIPHGHRPLARPGDVPYGILVPASLQCHSHRPSRSRLVVLVG